MCRFCSTDEEALSWLSDQMKLRAVQLANMKVTAATPKLGSVWRSAPRRTNGDTKPTIDWDDVSSLL